MSDNPLTWPMIAALPIELGDLSSTMLATIPCLEGPRLDAPDPLGVAERASET